MPNEMNKRLAATMVLIFLIGVIVCLLVVGVVQKMTTPPLAPTAEPSVMAQTAQAPTKQQPLCDSEISDLIKLHRMSIRKWTSSSRWDVSAYYEGTALSNSSVLVETEADTLEDAVRSVARKIAGLRSLEAKTAR